LALSTGGFSDLSWGAGTTAIELRHARPTVGIPFFVDQPFWGAQVHRLGVGPHPIPFARLNADNLSFAIDISVNDHAMRINPEALRAKMRAEDGIGRVVDYIHDFMGTSR
jgi:UDP:flavonoid glycosyltransferase YjiC (YdhE family)